MLTAILRCRRISFVGLTLLCFLSCSKSGTDNPGNPCEGITIAVNGTVTNTGGPGSATGSITATASGSSGFTFSLNNGPFQASGTFSNLVAGAYTIRAKNGDGCMGSGSFTVADGDPCAGKTITVTADIGSSEKCGKTGTITVTASGSTGFMYRLNASGTYQAANTFTQLEADNYTIYAKDAAGCETTKQVTVPAVANGPLFTAVVTLINSKCSGCHTGSNPTSGISFAADCAIVEKKNNIKTQAVDLGTMPKGGPALGASDKKIITDWIAAGGRASD
ncbi:hypothetical protein [Flavihumibacter sp. CACIAM 22H1]|uniref:hypothetical protein n=1 Tax=Flavihumibacter sp. CACIAM 22H1 TaxID=1812911 RepID=UPI0007A9256A|nr:hypothetical protein [Flavihumibacter sp. CACIAM 22H1]KYP15981.1 MAG: hypothetical protein A1D16_06890 [Flavihumibacter sp. CACIAM 22H1]